jgi:hypothetical protein
MKLVDLYARGVQCCGGQLIFRQQYVGHVNPDGSYDLNDRGKAALAEFVTGHRPIILDVKPPSIELPDMPPLSTKQPRRGLPKMDDPLA